MFNFQHKVEELRRYESLCYTMCLRILVEERAACKAAEQVLCVLFQEIGFWESNEGGRTSYIMRVCVRECLKSNQAKLVQTS